MAVNLDLVVATDPGNQTCEFRLLDEHGSQLAYWHCDFAAIPLSRQQGLFDLRNYVEHYVEKGKEEAAVAEVGVCIAKDVLGEEIFGRLWEPISQRTLRIRLPMIDRGQNHLAAALARVPWELARPATDHPSLDDRSLLVRIVQHQESVNQPLELAENECLRILFVFAEARGSRPLAARSELQQYRRLLEREVYPTRRVVADVLSNGVTLERLRAQIQENNGYHIVHWSGHGGANSLELANTGGARASLTGQGLLDLFISAGGFIPRLVFLSACHSGEVRSVRDWKEFLTVVQEEDASSSEIPAPDTTPLETEPGYTGTAHALLAGGVPSVVAMRYSVGDDYAREFGAEFYRALLAHKQPKTVAAALTMARQAVRGSQGQGRVRYAACDHATPVLFGAEQPGLSLPNGRSPGLNVRNIRLHLIAELTSAEHKHFVGRTWELTGLGADFIGASRGPDAKPVAVLTGLGGMGKTALAAEVLALWEQRFQWVLLYQAKPEPLQFETVLSDIHMKLKGELGRYCLHVQSNPADAIHRMATSEFTGQDRIERLVGNLIRALKDEPILLVLDNLETNLKSFADPTSHAGHPVWSFQDPAWDRCLGRLAEEIVGAPSRVLVTCRRPLAALAEKSFHSVQLGPLSPGEAALYLREHAGLSRMIFGGELAERALAMRLLTASRFHPLLMDRLARLATGGPKLWPQLLQALESLENSGDYSKLPTLFETVPGSSAELAYLNDALIISIDQLIEGCAAEARQLLWIIAMADDPVALALLRNIWSDKSLHEKEFSQPDLSSFLNYLITVGLVTAEGAWPDDGNPDLTCHELVRERIRARMKENNSNLSALTEAAIHLAYAKWMEATFHSLRQKDLTAAQEAGRRAIIYYVRARAYDRLGRFAIAVVVNASDPLLLDGLLPHLRAAADSAQGAERWRCLLILADAMDNSGRTNESLPLYEEAAALAKSSAEAGGLDMKQAWMDYSTIVGNWSIALQHVSDFERAGLRALERAEALRKAGAPAVYVISSELEALRIDVWRGKAAQALPRIEEGVAKMENLWLRSRAGEELPDAPDPPHLDHLFVSALDVDRQARTAVQDWSSALKRMDALIGVRRALNHPPEIVAVDQRNRAIMLTQLGRYSEAKSAFEECLPFFRNRPGDTAITLGGLADLFSELGDYAQAITQARRALAIFDSLPDPDDRCVGHHDLANFLEASGGASAVQEARLHRLASLAYIIESNLELRMENAVRSFALAFIRQPADSAEPIVPSLGELLADPAFHPLGEWLRERKVSVSELQISINEIFANLKESIVSVWNEDQSTGD